MKIDSEALHKIAHLARLNIHSDEEADLLNSLNGVLDWMAQLNEIDTTGVEPLTHLSPEVNVLRPDVVGQHLPRQQALANAPQHTDEFFEVPKVIG